MPTWLPYIPTIISAVVELIKLLISLAKQKDGDAIKSCSIELEKARKSGDMSRLEELLKLMREGKPCE